MLISVLCFKLLKSRMLLVCLCATVSHAGSGMQV